MTNEELNEKIATMLGWVNHKEAKNCQCENDHWKNKSSDMVWVGAPDYCNSWELSGELVEDLYSKNYILSLRVRNKSNVDVEFSHGNYNDDRCEIRVHSASGNNLQISFTADSPTRAIAEAWFETNKALLDGE